MTLADTFTLGAVERGARRTLALMPTLAAVANGIAAVALATVLAPGVSLGYGPANAAYVAGHLDMWRAGWALWIVAALSLLAFFGWWSARAGWPALARVAVLVGALGVAADVSAEARLIAWTAELDVSGALRQSGVIANTCYSLAGAALMHATKDHWPRHELWWGWAIWTLGIGLTVAAALSSDIGSQVLTAAIFVLLVPWLVVAGRRLS